MSRLLILIVWLSPFLVAAAQAPAHDITVIVGGLALRNVHKLSAEDQQRIIEEVKSQTYNTSNLDEISDEIGERVRFAFQKRGYFKVEVNESRINLTKQKGNRELIDVSVEVSEGEQYLLKEIGFSSTTVFSTAELRKSFPIADGDVFDREEIASGLENLRRLYRTKGYVNFSDVPETQIDEGERKISLRIDLDEGAAFHIGTLTVRGIESETGARERLLNAWRSYEGKVYDCGALDRFLRDLHARANVKAIKIFEMSEDEQKQVINVYVTLAQPIF